MKIECRRKGHEILTSHSYSICMELGCSDRAVKRPDAQVSRLERKWLQARKKARRRYAKIEEWETWDSDDMWIEHVWHWMGNPHRRWWQNILLSPVYLLIGIMTIMVAIFVLCTTDWG